MCQVGLQTGIDWGGGKKKRGGYYSPLVLPSPLFFSLFVSWAVRWKRKRADSSRWPSFWFYLRFCFQVFNECQGFSVKETQKVIDESLAHSTNVRQNTELQTKKKHKGLTRVLMDCIMVISFLIYLQWNRHNLSHATVTCRHKAIKIFCACHQPEPQNIRVPSGLMEWEQGIAYHLMCAMWPHC